MFYGAPANTVTICTRHTEEHEFGGKMSHNAHERTMRNDRMCRVVVSLNKALAPKPLLQHRILEQATVGVVDVVQTTRADLEGSSGTSIIHRR